MTAVEILPLPEHLTGFGGQASRGCAAEMHIDSARLDEPCRSGVGVHGSTVAERLGVVRVKDLLIEPDLASVGVNAEGGGVVPVLGCRGEPNLATHHQRRRPAALL